MPEQRKTRSETPSGLFGIRHSNRTKDEHWTKNAFNSSFPTAVACYMLSKGISAIYNKLELQNGKLKVVSTEIPMKDVFRCGKTPLDMLKFCFESRFTPYQRYADEIDTIDLVVEKTNGDENEDNQLAPLEIKLTVLPTHGTSRLPPEQWGCELVVRSATTSYAALGMFDSVKDKASSIRELFEPTCSGVGDWKNDFEMSNKTCELVQCVNVFQAKHLEKQKPLLLQVIWKTEGQSPILAEDAFDIVVWSDYAFSRLFLDDSQVKVDTMSRPMRASARLVRCLWELSKSSKINLDTIYRQMAFDVQTDKEFAIQGKKWRSYVSSERIAKPILGKSLVHEIIEPGCMELLQPERRLDQTLYFMIRLEKNSQTSIVK